MSLESRTSKEPSLTTEKGVYSAPAESSQIDRCTSSPFSGGSFVHFQYGFKYSIPLYLLATYTGYSRIESDRHYPEDVIVGAGLAILNSWYFTTPFSKEYALNLNNIPSILPHN